MSFWSSLAHAASVGTLSETRRRLRSWYGALMVASIAVLFAFLSMLIGQMLLLTPVEGPYYVSVLWAKSTLQWWNYPAVLAVQPWGIVTLPFFATVSMVLVSIGVGIGASVGILLLVPILRRRRDTDRRSAATGAAAGVGPAITGLATLGACCCTSCAGAAGITVVAAASGTSLGNVLLNDWYLGAFQIGIVYVSLLAQERVLRQANEYCPVPPPMDRRFAAGALLRLALIIAGITWSLAMFVEWGDTSPATAPAALWYHWIFEHQLLSVTAVVAGLFPKEVAATFRRTVTSPPIFLWRVALVVAAITWGIGVPASLASAGLGGFLNELFGYLGLPAAWGAVPPDSGLGIALLFHWTFQHLLLAGFGLALAVAPWIATRPLSWTTAPALLAVAEPVGAGPGSAAS